MESLAIIAYKQPITKGEIERIRGVNSDYSVQKLLEKELIIIAGRNENMPGHPLVYTTSKNFMDYFGINSTDDLPKIREVLAEQLVEGTLINPEDFNYNMNVPETMDQVEMNENYSTETEPIAEEETSTDDNTASSEPTDEQPI